MSAVLFIEKIHYPLVEKYRPLFDSAIQSRNRTRFGSAAWKATQEIILQYYRFMYVDGFFRDSYNATSIFRLLNPAWRNHLKSMCTKEGELHNDELKKLRDMVANADIKLPSKEEIESLGGKVDDWGDCSLVKWHSHLLEKHLALLVFLDRSITLSSPVHCFL